MSLGRLSSAAAGFTLAIALVLAACGQDQENHSAAKSPQAPISPLGYIPAEEQRSGDPKAGYAALVNQPYVTCGIPYAAYKQTAATPRPSHLLPGREGLNAELPYHRTSMVSQSGVELVTANCLSCHAGFFNGKLVVGLGNESADFTQDFSLYAESIGVYVAGDAEAAEWRTWADRMAAMAPHMITDTVGVNPANNLTLALIAHRDPDTLAWSQEPLLKLPPKKPLPVSVPPWWRMNKKHAMFYTGAGRGDHARFMMTASILCTDTVEEARAIDAYFPDIRAFIASLEPPIYPFDIDDKLADRGRSGFEQHCSRCHGTYGKNWTYPNLVIGLEEIGTDPELALSATRDEDPYIDWFNSSFFGELARWAPAPGYVAPPLDGVWATAPYLHNGSVPTLETLLDSSKRPTYWLRSFDSTDYNDRALGWNYIEPTQGKEGATDPNQQKRIYDTTLPGYSNQGHTFGDGLTDDERAAIIEYLKSL